MTPWYTVGLEMMPVRSGNGGLPGTMFHTGARDPAGAGVMAMPWGWYDVCVTPWRYAAQLMKPVAVGAGAAAPADAARPPLATGPSTTKSAAVSTNLNRDRS